MKRKITLAFSSPRFRKCFLIVIAFLFAQQYNAHAACNAEFTLTAAGNDSIHFNPIDPNATAYYWSFGDNVTSTDVSPWHQYSAAGYYVVCLSVYNSGVYCNWCDTILVGNPPCNADFSFYTIGNDSMHFYPMDPYATNYYWMFGDNTSSNDEFPWHQYANPGTYIVCLVVSDTAGSCTSCDTIQAGAVPCNAEFQYYTIGDSTHFYPLDADASFYYWSFGDNTTSSDEYPWHTYSSPGTYVVCLSVNDSGTYCTWCDTIQVGPMPCNAEFSYYTIGGDSLHFYPLDQSGTYYYWMFGDNTSSTDEFPWHQYANPGTYYVCLVVSDSNLTCTWCDSVVVGSMPCNAEFQYYTIGDSTHFFPLDADASFYYWSFGDNSTSTDEYPWHVYSSPGTYVVCLSVNDSGQYCTWCDTVQVGVLPCNAEFVYYALGQDSVLFNPADQNATSYYWSFGDSSTSTDMNPWHQYSAAGTYIVCLSVMDAGTYCSWCDTVVVGGTPCNAEFSYYTGNDPDSLHFYPINQDATSYYWLFSDSTYSTDEYPWHEFPGPGTYFVCLAVNDSGTYCYWCDTVQVFGVGIPGLAAPTPKVTVYPNPVNEFATLMLGNIVDPASIQIYDVNCKLTYSKEELTNGTYSISTKNMPAGLYFYTITANDKILSKGKIMVVH